MADQQESPDFRSVLIPLDFGFPSEVLMDRIFDQEDWEFIRREAPAVQSAFLRERKEIALLWLREARSCVVNLFHLHRLVARKSASLELAMEVETLVNYVSFLMLVGLAQCLIRLFGPFQARSVIGRVFVTVNRLSTAMGRVLTSLDPAVRAGIQNEWVGQTKPVG